MAKLEKICSKRFQLQVPRWQCSQVSSQAGNYKCNVFMPTQLPTPNQKSLWTLSQARVAQFSWKLNGWIRSRLRGREVFKALHQVTCWKVSQYLKVAFYYLSFSVPNILIYLFFFFMHFKSWNVDSALSTSFLRKMQWRYKSGYFQFHMWVLLVLSFTGPSKFLDTLLS